MATSQEHIKQWLHNRAFLQTIDPAYPDWIVTVTFYVALQAVDALLAKDNARITSHEERNSVLIHTNRYKQIWKHYQPLYGLARTVRYMADPSAWVPFAKIDQNIIKGMLLPIEQSVQKLSGLAMAITPVTFPGSSPPAPTPP